MFTTLSAKRSGSIPARVTVVIFLLHFQKLPPGVSQDLLHQQLLWVEDQARLEPRVLQLSWWQLSERTIRLQTIIQGVHPQS